MDGYRKNDTYLWIGYFPSFSVDTLIVERKLFFGNVGVVKCCIADIGCPRRPPVGCVTTQNLLCKKQAYAAWWTSRKGVVERVKNGEGWGFVLAYGITNTGYLGKGGEAATGVTGRGYAIA